MPLVSLLLNLSLKDGNLLLDGRLVTHAVIEHLPHLLHLNVLQQRERERRLLDSSNREAALCQSYSTPFTYPFFHLLASSVIESFLLLKVLLFGFYSLQNEDG